MRHIYTFHVYNIDELGGPENLENVTDEEAEKAAIDVAVNLPGEEEAGDTHGEAEDRIKKKYPMPHYWFDPEEYELEELWEPGDEDRPDYFEECRRAAGPMDW